MNRIVYEDIVRKALLEDIGFQDLTSEAIVSPTQTSSARLIAKEQGIIAGLEVAACAFDLLDSSAVFSAQVKDGDRVDVGQLIATVEGPTKTLLSAERTALNLLQRLSGIATATDKAVQAVRDFKCTVIDTRKTTPGLRALEKYAVRVGGAKNHRLGLFDAVLIKENHIAAAGGITRAVSMVKAKTGPTVKIEVEVENLVQLKEALACNVDIIMLDNMSIDQMSQAVELVKGNCLLEASGGITLNNLTEVAATGVDLISLGSVTHSPKALDISMRITL